MVLGTGSRRAEKVSLFFSYYILLYDMTKCPPQIPRTLPFALGVFELQGMGRRAQEGSFFTFFCIY